MPKLIVTHIRPDLDACCGVWLFKKYLPGFKEANVAFVDASSTYQNMPVDENPNVLHVDTGLGKFDHHQLTEKTSASERILNYLLAKKLINSESYEALDRLVNLVTFYDNFLEINLPEPTADVYELGLPQILLGLTFLDYSDEQIVDLASQIFDSVLVMLRQKVEAEAIIKSAQEFQIGKLKALAVETRNDEAVHLAQKQGFALVVRKDPHTQRARIKARPDNKLNLKKVYQAITKIKGETNKWFLHSSHKMLLNGSTKNSNYTPTELSLADLIAIIKKNLP